MFMPTKTNYKIMHLLPTLLEKLTVDHILKEKDPNVMTHCFSNFKVSANISLKSVMICKTR